MDIPQYIQQLIDNGIAHYDMDGCVVMNAAMNDIHENTNPNIHRYER